MVLTVFHYIELDLPEATTQYTKPKWLLMGGGHIQGQTRFCFEGLFSLIDVYASKHDEKMKCNIFSG